MRLAKYLLRPLEFTLALPALLAPAIAGAVPAIPTPVPVTQSDGSVLDVRIYGDEFHHFYTSEDGYFLQLRNGDFYYADIDATGKTVCSDIRATAPVLRDSRAKEYISHVDMGRVRAAMRAQGNDQRSRLAATLPWNSRRTPSKNAAPKGPGAVPDNTFPVVGKQKVLVILAEYSDVPMMLSTAKEYFTGLLNEPGFSEYGATGSAKEYFETVSCGQFQPEFDVYGVVKLPHTRAFYGANSVANGGHDGNAAQMIIDACEALDSEVDFSQYDRDGDGYVDNVFVFYAGRGEATGGGADCVWPHSWQLSAAFKSIPEFDGVKIDRYGCTNEWVVYGKNSAGAPDGVGTFVHEFSHVMGLPDVYSTSYNTDAFTPASWSVLDLGPYNNNGHTPPLYGAYERYAMGWIDPIPMKKPANAVLTPINSNRAGILRVSDSEYYLFENRQKEGWDKYIPGHGMLVWHIDYNEYVWKRNQCNNNPNHQYIDLLEADGIRSEGSRDGDCFPGKSKVTSLTDDTDPSLRGWERQETRTPITDIEETDGVVTFTVKGGRTEPLRGTVALEPSDIGETSFTAAWQRIDGAEYALTLLRKDEDEILPLFTDRFVGGAAFYTVKDLEPGYEYIYSVKVSDGWEYSDPSNSISVSLGPKPFDRKRVEVLAATDVTSDRFTANWLPLPEATEYLVSVFIKDFQGHFSDCLDFSDGVDKLPSGWHSSSSSAYLNDAYSGESAPALRMLLAGDWLSTPAYDDDIAMIKFWHRGTGTGKDDHISIFDISDGDNEGRLLKELEIITAAGGSIETVDLSDFKDLKKLKIVFSRASARGSLAIDDIEVLYGEKCDLVPMENFSMKPVGNTTSFVVDGLASGTLYTYTVCATDGTLTSRTSDGVDVRTTESDGIDAMPRETVTLSVADGSVLVNGSAEGVEVYSVSGMRVPNGRLCNGIYIVKAPGIDYAKITVR